MAWIRLERYAEYLATALHPVTGQKPVAAEFFQSKLGSGTPELRRARRVAHNLSVHGRFSEEQPTECTARCRRGGIRLSVEGKPHGSQ